MTGWISLFATLLLQSGISSRVRGSRLDIAELFQLSDRICRGPLTPIFCRIVLRVWIKKNIVLQSSFSKISTYSLFLLGIYFFFRYRLYVTMQQGKKPLVQKRSNMSSSPSYAIQQKIIFGKKYIVVIHVMFQSLVSRQLQTTKNVIGSLDIIQFLSNIQSLFYLYHNYQKINIHIFNYDSSEYNLDFF